MDFRRRWVGNRAWKRDVEKERKHLPLAEGEVTHMVQRRTLDMSITACSSCYSCHSTFSEHLLGNKAATKPALWSLQFNGDTGT